MQASGSLVVSSTSAESQLSMAIDNARLQTLVLINKTKVWQYVIEIQEVSESSWDIKMSNYFFLC